MIIQGLWDWQVDGIIYVKICDADKETYMYEPTAALLARWDKITKYKHSKHCHNKRIFSPFVISVDGMLGREVLVVLSKLSQVMAEKREEPLLQVKGWVKVRISIAVARSY